MGGRLRRVLPAHPRPVFRRTHYDPSSGSFGSASRIASSASVSGEGITYAPLAHLPRSMVRHRSLQKGNSASVLFTAFLQIGQRSLTARLRGIQILIVEGEAGLQIEKRLE